MIAYFFGLTCLLGLRVLPLTWAMPIMAGGGLVAAVGFADDRWGLSAFLRLFVHFLASTLTYGVLTDWFTQPLSISFLFNAPHVIVFLYSLFFIAWSINLYNFMDGVDGMAGTQAVVVSLISAGLCYWQGNVALFSLYFLLAFCVFGFLIFNWSPARIFMGDGGAYFLGFLFATLALISKVYSEQSLVAHVIVLGCFIMDATYTLFWRLFHREKIFQPHKRFAFQKAVLRGWSHSRITLMYNLITVFWLGPLAVFAVVHPNWSLVLMGIAYVPLLIMMLFFKAGREHVSAVVQ